MKNNLKSNHGGKILNKVDIIENRIEDLTKRVEDLERRVAMLYWLLLNKRTIRRSDKIYDLLLNDFNKPIKHPNVS